MSTSPPPRRRFLPPPEETGYRSHQRTALDTAPRVDRYESCHHDGNSLHPSILSLDEPPKPTYIPEHIETVWDSNLIAINVADDSSDTVTVTDSHHGSQPSIDASPRPRSRFRPQLIETTRRSKRATDRRPATRPTDKTDITPGTDHIYLPRSARPARSKLSPNLLSPNDIRARSLPPYRPYRQGSMRPHCNTRAGTRQGSFTPDLDSDGKLTWMVMEQSLSLESGEDFIEDTPSLSGTVGSSSSSSDYEQRHIRFDMSHKGARESCDEHFSGYLLNLAAMQAEQQLREQEKLREQALAAYPNSEFHEPVQHFVDCESDNEDLDDEDDGPVLLPHERVTRRTSTQAKKKSQAGFTAAELEMHEATLSRMRSEETLQLIAEEGANPSFPDPFWTNGTNSKRLSGNPAVVRDDAEFKAMRNAASPPMLGDDLVFRTCPSPKFTKFETDQRMEQSVPKATNGGGLWGGYCVASDEAQYIAPVRRGPQLLETPVNEIADPFASLSFGDELNGTKPRPKSVRGVQMLTGLNDRLKAEMAKEKRKEETIRDEFNDEFVTQVYNYLSLGYPILAQQYDDELAHITSVSKDQLQSLDSTNSPSGNIGIKTKTNFSPEANDGAMTIIATEEEKTPRWHALKEYIHEWARQHPDLEAQDSPTTWGVRARRGSWAI